jgi:ATP-dependent RNA helicase DDX49/DBP8
MATFKSLGLNQWLCDQLKELNVKTPTPVQENCIPEVLTGRDVLGCSKTGTGKTIAFAAPILQKVNCFEVFNIYTCFIFS